MGGYLLAGDSIETPATDRLISFIENPPVIEELIVLRHAPFKGEAELRSTFVLIRHQTDGIFYREALKLEDLFGTNTLPALRLAGNFGGEIWNLLLRRL